MDGTPAHMTPKQTPPCPSTLRMGTHNINGCLIHANKFKLYTHLDTWHRAKLSIVCLQETHIHSATSATDAQRTLDEASSLLHLPRWKAYWAYGPNKASAGVAILIRHDLIASGNICVTSPLQPSPNLPNEDKGRLLHLSITWGGHRLQIASIYLHSGKPILQQNFITNHLGPLRSLPHHHIWLGDFNFTMDPARDRLTRKGPTPDLNTNDPSTSNAAVLAPSIPPPTAQSTTPNFTTSPYHQDRRTASHFLVTTQQKMLDAFHSLHPHQTAYTYLHSNSASRIDRIHADMELQPFLHSCNVISRSCISDHRPVTLTLLARAADPNNGRGRGRQRAHMHYQNHPSLREEMTTWLMEMTLGAPTTTDLALILWWNTFKQALTAKISTLNKISRALSAKLTQDIVDAQANLETSILLVDAGVDAALQMAVHAKQSLTTLLSRRHQNSEALNRHEWIHSKERPQPLVTKLVRPPKDMDFIAALVCPNGSLATDRTSMAKTMIDFWANISRKPISTPTAAQSLILEAIAQDPSCHIPHRDTSSLGSTTITEDEVKRALKSSAPGRAPGPDGIPVALFKQNQSIFIPLLSRLYTAIGNTNGSPNHFSDGLIISLHKKGDKALPSNYRPITLLNYDYRLLAKILAIRLLHSLSPVISQEQTAFLRDRNIGDNVLLLQLLPHLLHHHHQSATIAFCDFAKAYDTIDRDFLFAIMQAMGAGETFITWTRILLSDTTAVAEVNGHVSRPRRFHAGVRQGCPLAPLLYLFIAQALVCWLKHRGLGITIPCDNPNNHSISPTNPPAISITAAQYADDTKILLPSSSLQDTQSLLAAMDVFQEATNQALNCAKTVLLHVGSSPEFPLPPTSNNLSITTKTTALGLTFENPIDISNTPSRPHRRNTRANTLPPPPVSIDALTTLASTTALTAARAATRLSSGHDTRHARRTVSTTSLQAMRAEENLRQAINTIHPTTQTTAPPDTPTTLGQATTTPSNIYTTATLSPLPTPTSEDTPVTTTLTARLTSAPHTNSTTQNHTLTSNVNTTANPSDNNPLATTASHLPSLNTHHGNPSLGVPFQELGFGEG